MCCGIFNNYAVANFSQSVPVEEFFLNRPIYGGRDVDVSSVARWFMADRVFADILQCRSDAVLRESLSSDVRLLEHILLQGGAAAAGCGKPVGGWSDCRGSVGAAVQWVRSS